MLYRTPLEEVGKTPHCYCCYSKHALSSAACWCKTAGLHERVQRQNL